MSHKRAVLDAITSAIGDVLGTEEIKKRVETALEGSASPTEVIESLRAGVEIVGRRYQAQEYFLSELIMAGIIAEEVIAMVRPRLTTSSRDALGNVLIGTVKGDVHDIGKKLVSTWLMSAGFDMLDIGVDVSAEDFLAAAREKKPSILAMSCLLTNAMDEMGRVIESLEKAGVRSDLRVLVGGRPVTREFADEIRADGYAPDAVEAVKAAKGLLS